MAATPGRLAAARVLVALETRGGMADLLLDEATRGLDSRERALAVALVQGVERSRTRLDHRLGPHARRPLASLDPEVRVALRMSAFQILDLSRIPTHAALHQAGEVCRALGAGRAVAFCTGVLRSFVADPGRARLPESGRDAVVVAESMPPWVADALVSLLGEAEALEAARAFNRPPTLTLRANRARAGRDRLLARLGEAGVAAGPGLWSEDAVRVADGGDPTRLPGWHEGWFTVQDEAAQLVGSLVAARAGDRVLDLCAAPGGKALQIAEAVAPSGEVVAADVDAARLARVAEAAARLGAQNVRTAVHDARRPFPGPPFPRVLVDAPCTGLGVLRRHPEARWQRSPEDVGRRALDQEAMLRAASRAVEPGGRLVYAVCSPLRAEGEDVVDRFLAGHPGWARQPAGPEAARTAAGDLRTWPHRHDTDAFFAAVLVRGAA